MKIAIASLLPLLALCFTMFEYPWKQKSKNKAEKLKNKYENTQTNTETNKEMHTTTFTDTALVANRSCEKCKTTLSS